MNYQETSVLIEHLAGGWKPDHEGLALDFVQHWKNNLKAGVEIEETSGNSIRFVTDLSDLRLRGMHAIPCLLSHSAEGLREFWRKAAGPGKLPFILALSDHAYRQAEQIVTGGRSLLLSATQLKQLMAAPDPRQFLKKQLHRQIPKQRLIAYDYLKSAEYGMFFGRRNELNRLRDDDGSSFAIAGPGKVGKSSLVKQYRNLIRRERDPRSAYQHYVDFYDCKDASPDGVARFFAMKIDSSRQSDRMTADGLLDFLRYQSYRLSGVALDLLLDEVDEVCQGEAFKMLGEAAKLGYCRLVLCGKGSLLKMMLHSDSPLRGRLELIQLEPLDPQASRRLIVEPLLDLGFEISDQDYLVDRVFRLTGRLPHLIQLYGKRLASLAIEEKTNLITSAQIETLKWDFSVAQIFTEPLRNLNNAETHLLALLLLKDGQQEYTIPAVQKIAENEGLETDLNHMTEVCNDLVISNVLSWHMGKYRVANEALYGYVQDIGLLTETAIDEARNTVLSQKSSDVFQKK